MGLDALKKTVVVMKVVKMEVPVPLMVHVAAQTILMANFVS